MSYIKLTNGSAFSDPSYTLRCFNQDFTNTIIDINDVSYHGTAYPLDDIGESGVVYSKVREGWFGLPGIVQSSLSGTNVNYPPVATSSTAAYVQDLNSANSLDQYTQLGIYTLGAAASPVSENSDGYQNYGIKVTVGTSGTLNLESLYEDNINSGFMSGNQDFYIEMPVWNWPGTALAGTICSITFSSSNSYESSQTVTIPFTAGSTVLTNSFSSSGDKIWRINRNILTNGSVGPGTVDIENIRRIKITLGPGTSSYDFKTGAMKVVPSTYSHHKANVDTKMGQLKMERWPGTAQPALPALVQNDLKVKNFKYISKFTVGTAALPGTTTPHELSLYSRVHPDRATYSNFYLKTLLSVDEDKTSLSLYQGTALIGTFSRSGSIPAGDYFLINNYKDDKVSSSLYSGEKHFIEELYLETGNQIIGDRWLNGDGIGFPITQVSRSNGTVSLQLSSGAANSARFKVGDRVVVENLETIGSLFNGDYTISGLGSSTIYYESEGKNLTTTACSGTVFINSVDGYDSASGYAGFEFNPQYGDFFIDYIYSKDVTLAEYESSIFLSNLPVDAANLFPNSLNDQEIFTLGQEGFEKVVNTDNFQRGVNEVGSLNTDVVVAEDTQIVYDQKSIKVTKSSNAYIASLQYSEVLSIPNFSKLVFQSKLRFDEKMSSGNFKIIFWDETRTRIAFIQDIPDLVPNKWNEINIPLISNNLYSNKLIFEIGHFGNVDQSSSFWIEEPSLTTESVEWELSNNGGITYYPVLTAISNQYKSLNFPSENFYSALAKNEPKFMFTFDDPSDINYVMGSAEDPTITNQYPYGTNSAEVTGPSTSNFAYPISMPRVINTYTVGEKYSIPKCVNTENKDFFLSLYDQGEFNIPTVSGFSNTDLTYSVWVYANHIEEDHSLGKHGSPVDWSLDLISPSNSDSGNYALRFSIGASYAESDIPRWDDNQWHQVVVTINSEYIKLYYDGENIDYFETSSVGSIPSITGPLYIEGPTSLSSAQLPDLANEVIKLDVSVPFTWLNAVVGYNKILTDEQIKNQYNIAISEYNQLRVRAKAYTKNAWIAGYELVPKYAHLGRIIDKQDTTNQILFDYARFDINKFGV